jgi:hypothetical protein
VSEDDKPLLIPIKRAAFLLGCCRETIYKMEKRSQIRIVRLFGRTMVPASEVERVVKGPSGDPPQRPKRRVKKVKLYPQES